MTLRQLEHFLAASEYLSFTKAAESLFMHQSAVSKSVLELEKELGTALFLRKKRVLELTEAGTLLAARAAYFMTELDDMLEEVRRVGSGLAGRIRAIVPAYYFQPLFETYREFYRTYPNILFTVRRCQVQETPGIIGSVLGRDCDLGLVFARDLQDIPPELSVYGLFKENFSAVVPAGSPLAAKKFVHISDLAGMTAVYYGDLRTPLDRINRALAEKALPPMTLVSLENGLNTPNDETLLLCVRSGQGISILPHNVAMQEKWGYAVLDIRDLGLHNSVSLIWRADSKNPALPLFLEIVKRHFGGK